MTKLLSHGEGLEFFIEGGRTRTGKAVIPKGGLLSVVVEACNEGMHLYFHKECIHVSSDFIMQVSEEKH